MLQIAMVHADWPTHRGNDQRTSFKEQRLVSSHWEPAWGFLDVSAPEPAWPAPARGSLWQRLSRIEPRVVDDQGDVPLIAFDSSGQMQVLVISSSMDRLISLDPLTGKSNWSFTADAPIRYAPHTGEGLAWFGSDDGVLRCIELLSGEVRWSYRIGPELPKIFGNGRLIGSHPIRTSVMVIEDRVYATAGLFPSQGVYAVALGKTDGECIWRRKLNRSPQGYLVADQDNRLCIPCGRATPFCLNGESGRFVCDLPSAGGTFCMVTREAFFSGPGNDSAVQSYPNLPDAKMLPIGGRAIAAGAGRVWYSGNEGIACHDLKKMMARSADSNNWLTPLEPAQALIVSGNDEEAFVFAAHGSNVTVLDGESGVRLHELSLPDKAESIRYLAVSTRQDNDQPELLIATTTLGNVYAWHGVGEPEKRGWRVNKAEGVAGIAEGKRQNALVEPDRLSAALAMMPSSIGLALLINDQDGSHAEYLARNTELQVVSVVGTKAGCDRLRATRFELGESGKRVVFFQHDSSGDVPFSEALFNLVYEVGETNYETGELRSYAVPGSGVVSRFATDPFHREAMPGIGVWRHQYGTPTNTSDSGDDWVGQAIDFRLQWFGGVGPARMPDRHLRAQSPLAAGSSVVLHGDSTLIGIDPANGLERWEIPLPPNAMRYVMPFDGGYSCLSADGGDLYTSIGHEIWKIDAVRGVQLATVSLPEEVAGMHWGYVAEHHGQLFVSVMKTDAPRLQGEPQRPDVVESDRFDPAVLRKRYAEQDYGSSRPLVCSRFLYSLDAEGQVKWKYDGNSVIANSAISLDFNGEKIVLVESRTESCLGSETDRLSVAELTRRAYVTCLDTASGEVLWSCPLPFNNANNCLYSLISGNKIVLATSESGEKKATYQLSAMRLEDGTQLWAKGHEHVAEGLGHGEQVHHPLALRQSSGKTILLAEPYAYDLESGERISPGSDDESWVLRRPGHSCGTLSGAGQCVFFRAGNPTVLNLGADSENAFQKLSPSRPGCWINMIPAGGRLLIPEGSASCVCSFPVQTSMGFVPIRGEGKGIELLEDFPPLAQEPIEPWYAWHFEPKALSEGRFAPSEGELALTAMEPVEFSDGGLILDGKQWLAIGDGRFDLPAMPATISLEASLVVGSSGIEWSGIVGALQDNGDFERGSLLGVRDDRFFFSVASEQKPKMTYLQSPRPIVVGQRYHLVGTYDGTLMKLYVDGKLLAVSSAQAGAIMFEQNSCLVAGIYKDDNDHLPLQGVLTKAAVYRGALPVDDIVSLANSTKIPD